MWCKLFPLHLAIVLSASQSLPAAATGASIVPQVESLWCTNNALEDVIESGWACRLANGVDCLAPVKAIVQLCIDKLERIDDVERHGFDLLKRNRNTFLGKRSSVKRDGSRNTFLGKREDLERFHRARNTFLGKRLAMEDDDNKRSRNRFLGKRFNSMSAEQRSSGETSGQYDQRPRLAISSKSEDDKRRGNVFSGHTDATDIKRSRNKFLG